MRVIGHQPGEKQPFQGFRHNYLYNPELRSATSLTEKDAILTSLPGRPAAAWRHKIFVGYAALMLLVFLVPAPATPLEELNHLDKVVHFGIFLVFTLLFYLDRGSRMRWTLLISFAFAAAIELMQSVLPYREGDWWDFVAGAAGASVGAVLMLLIEQRARRGAARSSQTRVNSEGSDYRAEERG